MARPNESELIVPLRNAWNITRYKRAPGPCKSFENKSSAT